MEAKKQIKHETSHNDSYKEKRHGVELIAEERNKQLAIYSSEHDDSHGYGGLAVVAAALAIHGTDAHIDDPHERVGDFNYDMWGLVEENKHDRIRRLTIAGALIAAEIDREQRILRRTLRAISE